MNIGSTSELIELILASGLAKSEYELAKILGVEPIQISLYRSGRARPSVYQEGQHRNVAFLMWFYFDCWPDDQFIREGRKAA